MKNIISLSAIVILLFTGTVFGQSRIYPPNLRAPVDGEQGVATDVTLDWDAVTGETLDITYELQLATSSDFSDAVTFDRTDVTATQMMDLKFNQTYYWRVKAYDDQTPSDWSEVWTFTTAGAVFFKTNPGPAIGAMVYANPTVSWVKLSGLVGFELQLDTVYGFQQENAGTSENINATFISDDGTDKWAVGDNGTVLHFVDPDWVTVDAGTSEDLFGVYFVANDNGYVVGAAGTIIHYDGANWTAETSGTTEDLNAVAFLDANTGWAVGTSGVVLKYDGGSWSEETTDNTNTLFDLAVLDASNVWACGASKTVLHFDGSSWTSEVVGSRDYYAMWFSDANNGWIAGKSGKVFHYNGTEWIEQATGTTRDLYGIAFRGDVGFAVGKYGEMITYHGGWAKMASGNDGGVLSSIYTNGTDILYAGEGGMLFSSTDGGFNSPYLKTFDVPGDSGTFEMMNLLFGKTFYYRIRAFNGQDTSDWNGAWSMSTYATPDLESPSDGASGLDLAQVFEWTKYEGATDYVYEIGFDENFDMSWTLPLDSNTVSFTTTVFGHEYFWRVQALHPEDISDWSEVWSFTTTNTVELDEPANNAEEVNTCPKFSWVKIDGVPKYQLAVDTDENFGNPNTVIVNTNFNQCQETMDRNTVYYWKVRAISGLDSSDWSPVWSFRTEGFIGFEDHQALPKVSVFPNPSSGDFVVNINSLTGQLYQVTVTDLAGKVLFEQEASCVPGDNKFELSLQGVDQGIYLINVKNGNKQVTEKLFVK